MLIRIKINYKTSVHSGFHFEMQMKKIPIALCVSQTSSLFDKICCHLPYISPHCLIPFIQAWFATFQAWLEWKSKASVLWMELLWRIIWLTKIEWMSFLERQLADLLILKYKLMAAHFSTQGHTQTLIVFQNVRRLSNRISGPGEISRYVTFYSAQKQSGCPSS